jgi:hypothetical protein
MPSRSRCSVKRRLVYWRPGVGVTDQLPGHDRAAVAVALPQRHPQWDHHQVGVLGARGVPGHDALGEHVDDEGDVDEPDPRAAVGEVSDPHTVGGRAGEVPVEQVTGPLAVGSRDRGARRLAAAHPGQAQGAHGPVHRPVAGAGQPSPAQVGRHLPPPVEPFGGQLPAAAGIGGPGNVPDRVKHLRVSDRAGRYRTGAAPGPVGACGDLAALLGQDPTDRLDRMPLGAHLIDEPGDHRLRGSSSPTKKVVAARRISTS